MAASYLQFSCCSSNLFSSSSSRKTSSLSSSSSRKSNIRAAIQFSKLPKLLLSDPTVDITRKLVEELNTRNSINICDRGTSSSPVQEPIASSTSPATAMAELYAILEAVKDRIETHANIGKQRDNWNSLLLNSINMMTLTATTMVGLATVTSDGGAPLKLSSALLFSAATGMLLIMNKIQPSQLAEEQRNAVRLFKQLETEIEKVISLRAANKKDVKDMMEKVLALDRAYPLPLLGAMLEKFPKSFEPAVWWPSKKNVKSQRSSLSPKILNETLRVERNGWSEELDAEMRAIVDVLKRKDEEDYMRLGNIALKVNKILAISGPLLTGIAACGTAFAGPSGGSGAAAMVAVTAGALAAAVNTFEHGGQVGMVIEMYRNCAGFFKLLEESIESTLEERDYDKRENGQLFERKVALKLGRSLSKLRDLAQKSICSSIQGPQVDEFASKLF